MNPALTKKGICAWFGITYQAHQQMKRRRWQRAIQEGLVLSRVREIRQELPRIGVRKLHHLLQDFYQAHGIAMGRDRLADLLRRHGLLVRKKRKGTRTTFPGGIRSENLLVSMVITEPNQVVVVDITYIETEQGFLYLALVTDLYSRKIIGWDLSSSLSVEGVTRAMEQAMAHIRQAGGATQGLIHHSDHGSQYTSRSYQTLLREAGIRPSMGAVGNAYDNAVAERVNGILKLEFLLDQRFPDAESAYRAVAQAIEAYNTKRPHLSLNYATPAAVYAHGMQQTGAQPAIAERDQKAPSQSRVGATGPDLRQPLTGSSFLTPSELAGCAAVLNSSYGNVLPPS